MQTQTSNTLHNAIMEAGSKDRPPMLAPGWKDKEVPTSKGSPITRTERVNETYKNVSQEIRDQLNAKAEAVQIILIGIDNDIYSTVDACLNASMSPPRIGNVAGAMETVGSTVVQKPGIQRYNCKEFGHVARECQKPKREKGAAYHRENMLLEEIDQNDDDNDLAKERELLASLIEKLKCEINESKNRNKFLETSNKVLIEKLKAQSVGSSNTEVLDSPCLLVLITGTSQRRQNDPSGSGRIIGLIPNLNHLMTSSTS
nr:hypothetical protein [Tanacetum cinerariifolium]